MRVEDVPLVDWLGYKIRSVRIPFEPTQPGSRFHIVNDGELLDEVAFRYYGQERLFYIIADVNGISDPFTALTGGQRLLIPPP